MATIGPVVVPRTIESSTTTTRLPARTSGNGLNFSRTEASREVCPGWMKVRPTYRFLISPSRNGSPDCSA